MTLPKTIAQIAFMAMLALPLGQATAAESAAMAAIPPSTAGGSDTIVIMSSDTTFGPDMEDATTAARYYCSTRGKVANLLGKERPVEFRSTVLQSWSVLTFHCDTPVK